ncbi:P-loop containing nucleoside triphosphate hydrolase protein [Leucosporidium creatinivorum]|uniref:p-loop containing nucleoside triphosphate hydrolase protein n=1 Tax=Leucosporidium creatinivorum TaxID=106004 RepID=A0A1Y2EVW6_9BASI|nr:P-loop containing nucleoside triphosphate hydrolase protein [Leucosporidium creatinivorum]
MPPANRLVPLARSALTPLAAPRLATCTCRFPTPSTSRAFSLSSSAQSHDNPLGLPRNDAPPTMPRMQRGLPKKRKIPGVKKVVVVSSGKGGVGKSSVSVNLALALSGLPAAADGARLRVGILDLDIFGPSLPKLMGLEGMGEPMLTSDNRLTPLRAHGLPCMSMGFLLPNSPTSDGTNNADTPVVWRGMMVMKAVQQLLFDVDWRAGSGHDLDVLVIDTPPGTGDVALSLGQLVDVDGSVIVTTPQDVAIIDTRKGVAMFRKIGIPITGAVLNMSHFLCPGSTTHHYIFGPPTSFRQTCSDLSLPILAEIPIEPTLSSCGDQGSPLVMMSSPFIARDSSHAPSEHDHKLPEAGKRGANGLDETSEDQRQDGARAAFERLAARVWNKL